jgi:hypothetical protein
MPSLAEAFKELEGPIETIAETCAPLKSGRRQGINRCNLDLL